MQSQIDKEHRYSPLKDFENYLFWEFGGEENKKKGIHRYYILTERGKITNADSFSFLMSGELSITLNQEGFKKIDGILQFFRDHVKQYQGIYNMMDSRESETRVLGKKLFKNIKSPNYFRKRKKLLLLIKKHKLKDY